MDKKGNELVARRVYGLIPTEKENTTPVKPHSNSIRCSGIQGHGANVSREALERLHNQGIIHGEGTMVGRDNEMIPSSAHF